MYKRSYVDVLMDYIQGDRCQVSGHDTQPVFFLNALLITMFITLQVSELIWDWVLCSPLTKHQVPLSNLSELQITCLYRASPPHSSVSSLFTVKTRVPLSTDPGSALYSTDTQYY